MQSAPHPPLLVSMSGCWVREEGEQREKPGIQQSVVLNVVILLQINTCGFLGCSASPCSAQRSSCVCFWRLIVVDTLTLLSC